MRTSDKSALVRLRKLNKNKWHMEETPRKNEREKIEKERLGFLIRFLSNFCKCYVFFICFSEICF